MTTTALASQWLLDTTRAFLSQENAHGLYSEPTLRALPGGYDLHLAPPDEETTLVLDGLLRLNDRDLITEYGTCRTALDLDRAAVFLQFIDPEAGRRRMIDVLALVAEDDRENER